MPESLDASMVIFHPDGRTLVDALRSLAAAAAVLKAERGTALALWIVDNADPPEGDAVHRLVEESGIAAAASVTVLSGHGNLGYGGGHNQAIRAGRGSHHLVLNYDLLLDERALVEGLAFMRAHPEVVLVSPRVVNGAGEQEFICKRAPNLFDLALRGFAPSRVRTLFSRRLARYEMRDRTRDEPVFGIEHAGGAFMLFERRTLDTLGGFDERFFLYFEDFDLSKRAAQRGTVAYVPAVRIVHYGGKAARKGADHRRMFIASARAYFAKHGWRLF